MGAIDDNDDDDGESENFFSLRVPHECHVKNNEITARVEPLQVS